MSARPSLNAIAEHVPLGFECRGCGGSAYNWLKKCARYVETGESCCADFHEWVRKAEAGELTVEEKRKAKNSGRAPFIGLPLGNEEWV